MSDRIMLYDSHGFQVLNELAEVVIADCRECLELASCLPCWFEDLEQRDRERIKRELQAEGVLA